MGVNVFDLKPNRPIVRGIMFNAVGPTMADGSFSTSGNASGTTGYTNKSSFDWNNLISNIGNNVSSLFDFLSWNKKAQTVENQYAYQQNSNNNMLWIGIAVVAVIVIAVVMVSRKK